MADAYVKHELHKGVTTIEFFHPQSNSLPGKLLNELAAAIKHANEDPGCIVIVIRSAGERAFCAGASFDELVAIKSEAEGLNFFQWLCQSDQCNAPLFEIYYWSYSWQMCVGGGVGLAAAVDYAIATEGAEVKLSELAIGIGPFVVGPAVERKIGSSAFSQLAIDASMFRNADWARRKGLYAELHPTIDAMDESVQRLVGSLVQSSPEAMAAIKKITWQGTENWDHLLMERAAISGRLVLSEFTKNAIQKFKTKS